MKTFEFEPKDLFVRWNGRFWDIVAIHYLTGQVVIHDNINEDYKTIPLSEVQFSVKVKD